LRAGAVVSEKRYALNAQNLAEAQYRVARNIAQEFGRKKEVQNPAATVNYQTYQAYLLARHHLGKQTTKDFERARTILMRFVDTCLNFDLLLVKNCKI